MAYSQYDIINKQTLLDAIYPVGSIYISLKDTSPAELFGGNWSRIKDVFLLTAGDNYTVTSKSKDGGSSSVTLTLEQIPSHYGHLYSSWLFTGTAKGKYLNADKMASYGEDTRGWNEDYSGEYYPAGQSLGGGQSHNNMPPYKVVYAWQRIANNVT